MDSEQQDSLAVCVKPYNMYQSAKYCSFNNTHTIDIAKYNSIQIFFFYDTLRAGTAALHSWHIFLADMVTVNR